MARMDPEFLSLVYPAVVREILHTLLLTTQLPPTDEGEPHDWIRLAETQFRAGPPPPEPGEDDSGTTEVIEWIDRAVAGFCRHWNAREAYTQMKIRESNG